MDVATLWITRKHFPETPELVCAWDGYSLEENWSGWEQACQDALAAVGDDLLAFRYLNIKVSELTLSEAFRDFKDLPVTDHGAFAGPQPR